VLKSDRDRLPAGTWEAVTMMQNHLLEPPGFELRFPSLAEPGLGLAFPCDREGHVDLDALGPRALGDYLFARAMIGREYAAPAVQPAATH
jgi:hypothetical protein